VDLGKGPSGPGMGSAFRWLEFLRDCEAPSAGAARPHASRILCFFVWVGGGGSEHKATPGNRRWDWPRQAGVGGKGGAAGDQGFRRKTRRRKKGARGAGARGGKTRGMWGRSFSRTIFGMSTKAEGRDGDGMVLFRATRSRRGQPGWFDARGRASKQAGPGISRLGDAVEALFGGDTR